jgi:hypothetical protein
LIKIIGKNESVQLGKGDVKITDTYIPVNSKTFNVEIDLTGRI